MSKTACDRERPRKSEAGVLQGIRQGQRNDAGLFGWLYSPGLDECTETFSNSTIALISTESARGESDRGGLGRKLINAYQEIVELFIGSPPLPFSLAVNEI